MGLELAEIWGGSLLVDGFDSAVSIPERARVFPLGGLVFFPNTLVPLHIFEPRYRQMMEDALADDRMFALVAPKSPISAEPVAVHSVACLGSIHHEERLEDGRFTLLLRGISRIKLLEEVPNPGKLYRQFRIAPIAEFKSPKLQTKREVQRAHLLSLLRSREPESNQHGNDFFDFLSSKCSIEVFTNLMSSIGFFDVAEKQELLEMPSVDDRLDRLAELLKGDSRDDVPLTGNFSLN